MNILFVVWNFYPNTAYTNRTKATVRGFVECGHVCDVLSIKPLISEEFGCLNHDEHTRQKPLYTFLGMVRNYMRIKHVAKEYDVIYCATGNNRIVELCINLAHKHGKVVVHERTEFPDIFYGKSTWAKTELVTYLKEVQRFDHLFVISTPIRDYFIEHGMPKEKVSIYPMIVDPNRFYGLKKQDLDYKYIAYCGNLSNSKDGVEVLIEAFGRSKAKSTHKLMLIGAKPSMSEMGIYRSLIDKYDITNQVVFRGGVERDEMPQILTDADLLVLSRPDNRQALGGFPTKLGEYLSTGNPVLVTRVGDIDKYIVDGENGYLSAPNDVDAFSSKMDLIFTAYENARKVGEKGRTLAYNEFNYSSQTKLVLEQINKLI